MKEYYYLDKANKIGPISEEELLRLNLDPDTLLWEESLDNWTKLSEIHEIRRKLPPPLPREYIEQNKKKSRKIVKSLLLLLILILVTSIFTYFIINQKIIESKEDLKYRAEAVFAGKNIICDGENYQVEGKLERIKISYTSGLNFSIPTEVYDDKVLWNKLKDRGYFDYYRLVRGGFQFKKLIKIDNGYELQEIDSKNMLYKINYSYRPSVQDAYSGAYDYLIEENESSLSKGSYNIISNFINLTSKYHSIDNVVKPSDHISYHWWYENMYVHNNYWKVYYRKDCRYYEIRLSDNALKIVLIKIGIIELSIILLIFLFVLIFNPFKW